MQNREKPLIICPEYATACERKLSDHNIARIGQQLHYPAVDSCLTVTLVHKDFVLGGHAGQWYKEEQDINPRKSLEKLIDLIIAQYGKEEICKGKKPCRIWFCGEANEDDWNTKAAVDNLRKALQLPENIEVKYDSSQGDFLFDPENGLKYKYKLSNEESKAVMKLNEGDTGKDLDYFARKAYVISKGSCEAL